MYINQSPEPHVSQSSEPQLNQPDTSTRSNSKDTNEGCEIWAMITSQKRHKYSEGVNQQEYYMLK